MPKCPGNPANRNRRTGRHLSLSEREKISRALKGKHHSCACKTAGSRKHRARTHHYHLSKAARARLSAKLRAEHAGRKWWSHSRYAKAHHESVYLLKQAKRGSGRSKAKAKRPC